MHAVSNARAVGAPLLLALAGLVCAAAPAQAADEWRWDASIYGWVPAIGGTTHFPPLGGGPNIDVSSREVLDALKMTFMGTLGAKKGPYGLWTDLVYSNLGGSKQGMRDFAIGEVQLPVGVTGDLSLNVKSTFWTLAGTYEVAATPQYTGDVVVGARMIDMTQTLDWALNGDIGGLGLPGRTGSTTVKQRNWDAIVGFKGQASLDAERKWFVPYYLDVGTGQSRLTYQLSAGVGYRFNWGSLVASWRYMDYQMKSGSAIESLSFNGPSIGAAFQW